MIELFDSHSHYNDEKFDEDREEIIKQTYESGVTKWICAGYNVSSSQQAIKIAKNHAPIYAICGISPNDVPEEKQQIEEQMQQIEILVKRAKQNKIVAVGEIGLDYYWNKENKEIQKEAFCNQIDLANRYELPIVIHTREAVMDTIQVLKQKPVKQKGIFHCCPFNRELVKEALALGFYISFAGPVTFKNAKQAPEIIQMVPLEKILIETDSPYLAPEPKRGTRNNSCNVYYIAQKIATIKDLPIEQIANITYKNAKTIFKIEEE